MIRGFFKNVSNTGFTKIGKGRYKYSRFLAWRSVGYIVTEKQKSLISLSMFKASTNALWVLMSIIFFGGILEVHLGYRLLAILFCASYFSYVHEKYVGNILSECEKIKDERRGSTRFLEHISVLADTLEWKQIIFSIFIGLFCLSFVALLDRQRIRESEFGLAVAAIFALISIMVIVSYLLLLFMKWSRNKSRGGGQ